MSSHRWKFFRAGGVEQVALESAKDLVNLDQLDQKLWVALSCPVKGLEFDVKTLELIDGDKDGRIRAPDMIAAAKWAAANLKDPEILLNPSEALPLSAINDATDEGKRLLASARQILANLGKEPTAITAADTADTAKVFSATKFNGDGIIPVDATPDPALQQVLKDLIATVGAEIDRTNTPGVSQSKVDLFFKEAQAFSDWNGKAEAAGVLILGEKTGGAMTALEAVRAKLEDYFVRCRLAAFDPRALTALNRPEQEYVTVAAKDLSAAAPEMMGLSNRDHRPMPYGIGFHPAFVWPLPGCAGLEHSVTLDNGRSPVLIRLSGGLVAPFAHPSPFKAGVLTLSPDLFEADAMLFPEGAGAGLTYAAGDRAIHFTWENLPNLAIWSKPGAPFVCLEPWHGTAAEVGENDALDERPYVEILGPGASGRYSFKAELVS
jgi:hypothetical protein